MRKSQGGRVKKLLALRAQRVRANAEAAGMGQSGARKGKDTLHNKSGAEKVHRAQRTPCCKTAPTSFNGTATEFAT